VSVHFSTVTPRRSRGRVGIVATVDGYTLRGCGIMLETRAVRRSHVDGEASALAAFGRGVVYGTVLSVIQFGPILLGLAVLS
jgi:hypothetical protein